MVVQWDSTSWWSSQTIHWGLSGLQSLVGFIILRNDIYIHFPGSFRTCRSNHRALCSIPSEIDVDFIITRNKFKNCILKVTLMSTTILHDATSQDWTNPKPFYESEKISHCVQMWWFTIQVIMMNIFLYLVILTTKWNCNNNLYS